MAPQKNSRGLQGQFFHQLDRPSATRTMRSTENIEENLKTSTASSPSMTRAWRLRASSAHPREAESYSFLACAAKENNRLSAATTRRCTPSLSSAPLGTRQRVLCEMLLFSDLIKFREQYLVFRWNPKPYFSTKTNRLQVDSFKKVDLNRLDS